jgi:hypothetical protein
MKHAVTGKNEDGSPHITYTPEGMTDQLLYELWELWELKKTKYPLSLRCGKNLVSFDNRRDLGNFLRGLTVGFDMNRVF